MYISMKTYSKKLLVAFFFSMLPMVLMSCSMDPEKASFSISGNLEKLQIGNDGFTEVYSIKSNTEWKFVPVSAATRKYIRCCQLRNIRSFHSKFVISITL